MRSRQCLKACYLSQRIHLTACSAAPKPPGEIRGLQQHESQQTVAAVPRVKLVLLGDSVSTLPTDLSLAWRLSGSLGTARNTQPDSELQKDSTQQNNRDHMSERQFALLFASACTLQKHALPEQQCLAKDLTCTASPMHDMHQHTICTDTWHAGCWQILPGAAVRAWAV